MWGIVIFLNIEKRWVWDTLPKYSSKEEAIRVLRLLYPESKMNLESNKFFSVAQEIEQCLNNI